jgi:hypothetical protein
MNIRNLALLAALTLAPAAVFAQAPTPGRNEANIHQRKVEQQRRIASGVRTGELTRRETAHLERGERRINREERSMRIRNGGRLTGRDRRVIHRQQNRVSRRIYRARHNRRVS